MLFSSNSTKDDARVSEELVVLSHNGRRLLVPLPDTYEDALECARSHFSVKAEAAVVFETRELSGCDGQAVEIHETSWQGIRQVLSQIDVRLVNHAQDQREEEEVLESLDHLQLDEGQNLSKAEASSQEDQPIAVASVRKRPSLAPRGDGALPRLDRRSIAGPSKPESKRASVASGKKPESTTIFRSPPTSASAPKSPKEAAPSALRLPSRQSLSYDEEDEEDSVPRSPKKGSARARQRVMSDEEEEEDYEQPSTSRSPSDSGHRKPSSIFGHDTAQTPRSVKPTSASKKQVASTPSSSVNRASLSTESPKPKPVAPDGVCLIHVDFDDGVDTNSSPFKAKGKHTVHKVLMTVCKTFGIEHLYSKAELVQVITQSANEYDPDSQPIQHTIICPRTHTMSELGAHDDSHFVVMINEDDESSA